MDEKEDRNSVMKKMKLKRKYLLKEVLHREIISQMYSNN